MDSNLTGFKNVKSSKIESLGINFEEYIMKKLTPNIFI